MRDFSIFQYAYAISGGIGSGKSSACQILEDLGYEVIDADKIAHQILDSEQKHLVEVFGESIIEKGRISRKRLGQIVFGDSKQMQKLNSLLSPSIQECLYQQCLKLEQKQKIYFVEIALLFEQREIYNFQKSILIVCSKEEQIKRICQRNHLTSSEVQIRIDSQMSLADKIPLAQNVIMNTGSLADFEQEIKRWLNLKLPQT